MALKLMYITNNPLVATVAENSGVDRIWIDLEWIGKEARQTGMDTVKSDHQVSDVAKLRPYVNKSELMVRLNSLHEYSMEEIDAVVAGGADLIMLPFFHTVDEVRKFVELVDGRAKVMLLVETKKAFETLEEIVKIPGVDEIHIGLNDLHLSYGMTFMFELLANGMIERACQIIKDAGIPYGFGGIAGLGEGLLPAEHIVAEHYRLGSSMVILSRTFCDTWTNKHEDSFKDVFANGVKALRDYEDLMAAQSEAFFEANKKTVQEKVNQIVEVIKEKRRSRN
jgi:2-keto-3-deoxy-L-rhamnonate aldolase RhmA